jgi:hypothetical protein
MANLMHLGEDERTGVTTSDLIGGIELGRSADVCIRHDGGVV